MSQPTARKPVVATTKPAGVRTIADFRAAHDRGVIVPNKIRAALEEMRKKGPQHYEYESDFMKLAGIAQGDISAFRDQFADHIVIAKVGLGRSNQRNVWFATVKAAKEVRGA